MAKETEIATTTSSYEIVPVSGPNSPLEIIDANLNGKPLQVRHLTRVVMPGMGSTEWKVRTIEGTRSEESLTGVIIHQQTTRAYYRGAYSGGNDQPDCSSSDGITGSPGPNGEGPTRCEHCPMNQWESAARGKGKACAEYVNLYLLPSGKALPLVVRISPGSLRRWDEFVQMLTGDLTRLDRVVVSLSIDDVSGYPEAMFEVVDYLDDAQHAKVMDYRQQFAGLVTGRQTGFSQPIDTDEPPQFRDDGSEIDPDDLPFQ